jgi:hypothetical protein
VIDIPEPPRPFTTGARLAIIRAARLAEAEARRAVLRHRLELARRLRAEVNRLMKEIQS